MLGQLSSDLKAALLRKQVSPEDIEKIITELTQAGYLNDQVWIESFIRVQIQKKNGPSVITKKLMQKGIPAEMAKKAVNKQTKPKDLSQSVQRLMETKYKNKNLKDFKERQKVVASLIRKGFSLDTIKSCLNVELEQEFD